METLITVLGYALMIYLVLLLISFIGTEVIYRKRINTVNAIFMYTIKQKFQDHISFDAMRKWKLIDCFCPWRWRYKYLLPEEEFEKIAPFLGRK